LGAFGINSSSNFIKNLKFSINVKIEYFEQNEDSNQTKIRNFEKSSFIVSIHHQKVFLNGNGKFYVLVLSILMFLFFNKEIFLRFENLGEEKRKAKKRFRTRQFSNDASSLFRVEDVLLHVVLASVVIFLNKIHIMNSQFLPVVIVCFTGFSVA
jgi:hypothetical protein